MPDTTRWWGHYEIPENLAIRWRVGPLTLWAHRLPWEWRIAWRTTHEALDDSLQVGTPQEPEDFLSWENLLRFGFAQPGRTVTLRPALADRPVVSRPERPFTIPGGETVTLYVSSPLWVRVHAGKATRELVDIPIYRPSDTWFGSSTREGELCYASRAFGRMQLAEVPFRPHRVTTEVVIRNRLGTPLLLERVNLPALHLSLYVGRGGLMWTQSVTYERVAEHDYAPVRLSEAPPAEAGASELLSGPRVPAADNLMVRAFSRLFRTR